ncbi:MAG: SDR family oxidoreductase, partial [Alphaproteobacteria bacterium]|nr:SDR family oxidoreductase [Alphaproteobacteria bacterium]
ANAIPLKRFATPDDVVGCFLFLCSPAASYLTGTTIVVDGGQHLEARSHDVMFSYGIDPSAPVGRKR